MLRPACRRAYALAILLSFAVSACGGGGGGSSTPPVTPPGSGGTPPPTSTPQAGIQITGIDNTTPTALTALHLSTTGVNASQPVTITFASGSNFSVSVAPISVAQDGSIAVAVPQYIDPSTGQTAPVSATLTVTQNGVSSAPANVSIQDIPPLSAYGTAPGAITRTFYNYEIMSMGQQLGELHALQVSNGNTVDTSQAQNDASTMLVETMQARNDVDRVMLNNSLSIPVGTLPNGAPLTFDANTIAMQDRIIGWYLVNLAAATGGNSTLSVVRHPMGFTHHARRTLSTSSVTTILGQIGTLIGSVNATLDFQEAASKPASAVNVLEATLAVVGGTAAALAAFPAVAAVVGVTATGATAVAIGAATVNIWTHVYHEVTDLQLIENQATNGATAAQVQAAQSDLDGQWKAALLNGADVFLGYASISGSLGQQVIQALGADSLPEVGGFVKEVYGLAGNLATTDMQTDENGANEIGASFNSPNPDFFNDVTGSLQINNSNGAGSPLAGLPGAQLDQGTTIIGSGVADPSGTYEFPIPDQDPNISYSNLTLTAYDPVTNTGLASTNVDLSALATGGTNVPAQLPTLSASCTDDDANNPDADDPDCD